MKKRLFFMVLFAVLIGVLIEAGLWFIKMHDSKRGFRLKSKDKSGLTRLH
jgi:hypothetical protein